MKGDVMAVASSSEIPKISTRLLGTNVPEDCIQMLY